MQKMKKQSKKLRLLYLPFLIIAISVIGGYTFLNWLIICKLQFISIKDIIVSFIIPFILPWIPILIWLRPRIKLLNLETKRDSNLPFLYQLIAAFAIAAPTIVAQAYLDTATGKLTELDNISQIDKQEATKYYTLNNCYVDKEHLSYTNKFEVSGKYSEDLNLLIYVVCPILKSKKMSEDLLRKGSGNSNPVIIIDGKQAPDDYLVRDTVKAWLGIVYKDRMSNSLSSEEKEKLVKLFAQNSQYEFNNAELSKFVYLKRQGNTEDLDEYIKAIKSSSLVSMTNTVLISVNEPFESRNGNKFAWIFGAFGIGTFIWLIMILIPKFKEKELENFEEGKPTKDYDLSDSLSLLIPKKEYFITPIILDLNLLIFIIMVFAGLGFISFQGSDLLKWGANYKPLTTDGEWWRLLSNTFLHGGIMHLIANMYGLLFVGIFLEPRIGRSKFAWIYLACGILASFTSLWWHEATVSVGASGAIFGLYGLFLALMLTKVYPKEFSKALLIGTLVFIGFNLLFGLTGGIDNAAHLGGLVSGFVIGLFISPQLKEETEQLMTEGERD